MRAAFDPPEVLDLIRQQAEGLAVRLDKLAEADWERPSACAGWAIADVFAHLAAGIALQRRSIANGLRGETSRPYSDAERIALIEAKRSLPAADKSSDYRADMAALLAIYANLGEADLDTLAWHFAGVQPIRWFLLQRLGETMIHRGDVLEGLAEPFEYPDRESRLLVATYAGRLPRLLRPDNRSDLRRTILFRDVGTLTIADGRARFDEAVEAPRPDLELDGPPAVLLRMSTGRLHPGDAFSKGLIQAVGDTQLLSNWHEIFSPL